MEQYSGGTAASQNLTGTYAFTSLSGRLGITGASPAASPICYLTNPFDGVSAFCISMDPSASLGIFDTQPAATYSASSLSGNFFFGSGEPGDNTVPDFSGVARISSGNLQGAMDKSGQAGFSLARVGLFHGRQENLLHTLKVRWHGFSYSGLYQLKRFRRADCLTMSEPAAGASNRSLLGGRFRLGLERQALGWSMRPSRARSAAE